MIQRFPTKLAVEVQADRLSQLDALTSLAPSERTTLTENLSRLRKAIERYCESAAQELVSIIDDTLAIPTLGICHLSICWEAAWDHSRSLQKAFDRDIQGLKDADPMISAYCSQLVSGINQAVQDLGDLPILKSTDAEFKDALLGIRTDIMRVLSSDVSVVTPQIINALDVLETLKTRNPEELSP